MTRPIVLVSLFLSTAALAESPAADAAVPAVETPSLVPDLEFDLLGAPPPSAATGVDQAALERRRTMLQVHQGLGMGLMALELSTLVLGQLNYRDQFGGGSRSGDFRTPHAVLAYTTFGFFVTNELLALLAPVPIKKESQGFDRATLHKVAMFTAAAGMIANVALGAWGAYGADPGDQRALARTHLFIGYGTYAAMAVGASAFIF